MGTIFTIACKDLKQLLRDPMGLFFVIAFPVLMALFFGSVFGGSGGGGSRSLGVAVVREDDSAMATSFVANLAADKALRVYETDMETARHNVQRGVEATIALVHIKESFGEDYGILGDEKSVVVAIDPSRQAEAGFLQGILMRALITTLQDAFTDWDFALGAIDDWGDRVNEAGDDMSAADRTVLTAWFGALRGVVSLAKNTYGDETSDEHPSAASESDAPVDADNNSEGAAETEDADADNGGLEFGFEIESLALDRSGQPRSGYDITFPSSILWGIVGCVSAFAISIVVERTRGTYQRLRMAPIGSASILLGKGLACFLSAMTTITILMALGRLAFGVTVGSWLHLAMAAVSTSFCFVGAMMFIAVLGKTEASVGGAGWAIFIVWMMFGGGMLPLIAMPEWMIAVSNYSPVAWGVYALEGAVWRDLSFREMLYTCGMLITVGGIMFVIGWEILRARDARGE